MIRVFHWFKSLELIGDKMELQFNYLNMKVTIYSSNTSIHAQNFGTTDRRLMIGK